MPSWSAVTTAAPELAEAVRSRFEAHGLGYLATLRRDGFPRVSGIEPGFNDEVWLGMMPQSRKALDLLRDPRLTLHSANVDKEVRDGDAKLTGLAVAVTDPAELERARADAGDAPPPPAGMHLFRVDVREIAFVRPVVDRLVIDSWSEAHGLRRVERT